MQASEPAVHAAARRFFAATGPSYERVARWATLGQDARWRGAALACLPHGKADVLDYACGTGLLTVAAAKRCAPGRVVGVDLSASMLAAARAKAAPLSNVALVEADAETWDPPAAGFDAVLAAYLPKYVSMDHWLPRAARALRPRGVLVAYDFSHPEGPIARRAWEVWWAFVAPRLRRDPAWRSVAGELDVLVRGSRWLPDLLEGLGPAGLELRRVRPLTFGAATLVEAVRGNGPRPGPGTL